MKQLFVLFITMCILPAYVYGSVNIFKSGNNYGLKSPDGKIVLNPQYQEIHRLSYTPSKNFIVPMHAMDKIEEKQTDFFKIKKNNLWGIANVEGKITEPCKYDDIKAAGNGELVLYTDGNTRYVNPIKNAAKNTKNTVVTIVALPVTIIGTIMLPVEMMSKIGKNE